MKERLETLAKAAAAIALLSYLVGLLATALYLERKLDVPLPDIAALKPRFAYTGALVLAPLAFIAGPLCVGVRERKRHRAILTALSLAVIAALECAVYLYVLRHDQDAAMTGSHLRVAAGLVASAACTGLLAAVVWEVGDAPANRSATVALGSLGALLSIGFFLILFTGHVLPQIPDQFGGLRPSRVRLLIAADAVTDAETIGIEFPLHTRLSGPVDVLYAGDQYYVLHPVGKRVVQLAHEAVLGSITDSKRPTAQSLYALPAEGDGAPPTGGRLVLAYSEAIDPHSVLRAWEGDPVPITLKVTLLAKRRDAASVTFLKPGTTMKASLGHVELSVDGADHADGALVDGTMVRLKRKIVVSIADVPAALKGALESWEPSTKAKDFGGNHVVRGRLGAGRHAPPGVRTQL